MSSKTLLSPYFAAAARIWRPDRLALCFEAMEKVADLVIRPELPRIDAHVHLAVDPVDDPHQAGAAQRLHAVLNGRLLSYDTPAGTVEFCELPEVEALTNESPLDHFDLFRLARHALLNEAMDNVPHVVGAAMAGGRGALDRPGVVVALVPDFSQTPVLRLAGGALEQMALAARAARLGYLGEVQPNPRWYGTLPKGVVATGWDDRRDVLERALEEHRWITRISGGAVVAFAGFDPRTERAAERLKDWVTTASRPGRGLVGVKCYSRCGWAVTDNQRLYGQPEGDALDATVDGMLSWATQEGIPVTNHQSPGGWPAYGQLLAPKNVARLMERPRLPRAGGRIGSAEWLADLALVETAAQCAYVQATAAPNAWLPALRKHPELRLNLAHAGTAAAGLCHFGLLAEADIAAPRMEEHRYLHHWPIVAGETWFPKLFPAAARLRLQALTSAMAMAPLAGTGPPAATLYQAVPFAYRVRFQDREPVLAGRLDLPTQCEAALEAALLGPDWQAWIAAFAGTLGPDWTTQSLRLVSQQRNVYLDLSYFSTGPALEAVLDRLFRAAFGAGPGSGDDGIHWNRVRERMLFGTDWFMTEVDHTTAWAFWARVREAFRTGVGSPPATGGAEPSGWEDLISCNTLRFLNLGPRLAKWREFFGAANGREGKLLVGLQETWEAVRRFYATAPKSP